MTSPQLRSRGAYRNPFTSGDRRYASVTTIIDQGYPKAWGIPWAAKETALAWAEQAWLFAALTEGDLIDEGVRLLKAAHASKRDDAAAHGTDAHALFEEIILGVEPEGVPDTLAPYVDQFRRWVHDFSPALVAAEVTCFNDEHGYAGTFDLACRVDGIGTLLVDYKTGNCPRDYDTRRYPRLGRGGAAWDHRTGGDGYGPCKGAKETEALQLTAYLRADYWALPDGAGGWRRQEPAEFDAAAVLHVRDDHYKFVTVSTDGATFDAFLAAKHIAAWAKRTYISGEPVSRRATDDVFDRLAVPVVQG